MIAPRQCIVMILGETGTGKEMVARRLHAESHRKQAPFIPVDCSAISDSLFEGELFGHVRGAFTGAVRDSLGFVRAADGGTLFLDEIAEMSLRLQAKMLRVIQERCVIPVGDTRPCPVDVRIVAATHRNLAEMVREGTFRQDLYFRLNVLALHVPPLRDHPEDIPALAEHFLNLQSDLYDEPRRTLSAEARTALQGHSWPGNIRELANVIEYAYILSTGPEIKPGDLPETVRPAPDDSGVGVGGAMLRLIDIERMAIVAALRRTNYCKAAAARLLGINIQRLNRCIVRMKILLP